MTNRHRLRAALLTILGLVFSAVVDRFFLTLPNAVVVSADGSVDGLLNRGRAVAQGDAFWRGQRDELMARIAALEAATPRHHAEEPSFDEALRGAARILSDPDREGEDPLVAARRRVTSARKYATDLERQAARRRADEQRAEELDERRRALELVNSELDAAE